MDNKDELKTIGGIIKLQSDKKYIKLKKGKK